MIMMILLHAVGSDFNASPVTHSLDASSNSQGCLTVTIMNNNTVENVETFTIQLSTTDSGVTLSPSNATATITDIGMYWIQDTQAKPK